MINLIIFKNFFDLWQTIQDDSTLVWSRSLKVLAPKKNSARISKNISRKTNFGLRQTDIESNVGKERPVDPFDTSRALRENWFCCLIFFLVFDFENGGTPTQLNTIVFGRARQIAS